jgi:pyruvate formate lyase activating enzyme
LDTIKLFHELGIWIEVTTLVIPGWNDSRGELQEIAEFLAGVGTEIPWHVTRFFPAYKLADAPPTPLDTLETARKIGKEAGLQYVYIGNAAREKDAETTCPSCGSVVIRRAGAGSGTDTPGVPSCATCGRRIEGVWE